MERNGKNQNVLEFDVEKDNEIIFLFDYPACLVIIVFFYCLTFISQIVLGKRCGLSLILEKDESGKVVFNNMASLE